MAGNETIWGGCAIIGGFVITFMNPTIYGGVIAAIVGLILLCVGHSKGQWK